MKVENKVIVVTGAGSGMGRELTLQLLARGAKVAAVDINLQTLEQTARLAGANEGSLNLFVTDITDKTAVENLLDKVNSSFGCVDGIINNAGIIQPFVKLIDLNYETIDKVLKVNFYGTLYMVKTFLPALLARPEAHIVNISSMGGFLPVPGQTIYGASKAAIKLMTEGLHSELANTNVRVTVVFPGGVNTNIMANSGLPDIPGASSGKGASNILSAEKAAAIIVGGMEKNRYRVLAGKDARMMDLFYRLNPAYAARLIAKAMRNLLSK